MKFLAILFIFYCFLKTVFYGIYEINTKKNKHGGITVIFISLVGLLLPIILLILFY